MAKNKASESCTDFHREKVKTPSFKNSEMITNRLYKKQKPTEGNIQSSNPQKL